MGEDTDSTQRLEAAMAEVGKPSAETDTAEQSSSDSVFTKLHRMSELAKQDPALQCTSLAHLLTVEMLILSEKLSVSLRNVTTPEGV